MATTEQAVRDVEAPKETKASKRKRGRVRVFAKWCKGCGLCIAFCPQQVFEQDADHHPVVAHPERCVACEWCVVHCPDFAITVQEVDTEQEQIGK